MKFHAPTKQFTVSQSDLTMAATTTGRRMMDEFRKLAIEEAVNKLFREKHFSICTLDEIIELSGVIPNHGIRKELRVFHCKDYADMSPRVRQLIQQKVVECLRGDASLNPARVLHMLTDEGRDFAFTEDRYLDGPLN